MGELGAGPQGPVMLHGIPGKAIIGVRDVPEDLGGGGYCLRVKVGHDVSSGFLDLGVVLGHRGAGPSPSQSVLLL